MAFGEDAEPHYVVYLARTLQQHGTLEEAIQILRRGARRYKNNYVILTSLGVDLERARADDEALSILLPIFERFPFNTRAALGIIRIHLRRDRADRHSQGAMRFFATTAKAEIWIAEHRAEAAVEFLKSEMTKDQNLVGIFLEAVYQAALSAESDVRRNELIGMGVATVVPNRLRFNVPVQINRARIAILACDNVLFDGIIDDLEKTKINPAEIERLAWQWDELNGGGYRE